MPIERGIAVRISGEEHLGLPRDVDLGNGTGKVSAVGVKHCDVDGLLPGKTIVLTMTRSL